MLGELLRRQALSRIKDKSARGVNKFRRRSRPRKVVKMMRCSQESHLGGSHYTMTVVLFTLLAALICGALALSSKAQTKTSDDTVTPETVPGRNGKIAFSSSLSSRDRNSEIYTMEADGSNVTRLTLDPRNDIEPAWSPDGRKIAFVRSEVSYSTDRPGEIYVMNADGSDQRRLTELSCCQPPHMVS